MKTLCFRIERRHNNHPFSFAYGQASCFVSDAVTQRAQWQPVIVKSNMTGGRQKHQTDITIYLTAVYLHWDEASLKQRSKGHSTGPHSRASALGLISLYGMCYNLAVFSMHKAARRQGKKKSSDIYHSRISKTFCILLDLNTKMPIDSIVEKMPFYQFYILILNTT